MLRIAPTAGERVMLASWKLLSSRTDQVSREILPRRFSIGTPMFPPTTEGIPASRRMLPVSDGVVVFPLLPVIPTIGPGHSSKKSAVADESGIACCLGPATAG